MTETKHRLLDFAKCSGCAGKIPPAAIAQILGALPPRSMDSRLLVGTETSDDAGVYLLQDGLALVQTLDFFPPLVDDPFTYGQIAATNALSDVYAMNGRPITAMNIVAFPDDVLPLTILAEILRGAADRVSKSGAVTLGGHSLRDSEIKFGLSVTGLVDPSELMTNAGAREGDLLVLTKPLGTGFVTTANKKGECPPAIFSAAVASMTQLNELGRDALRACQGVHAVTDVTGFGLAGHGSEMAEGSNRTIRLFSKNLPSIEGLDPLIVPAFHTRATRTNREFLEGRIRIEASATSRGIELAFDAQTSGGLLIAIDADHADALVRELQDRGALASAIVGRVEPREGSLAVIVS